MREIIQGSVRTVDRVSIAYEHVRAGRPGLVVVCPGFYNSMKNRLLLATRSIVDPEFDTLMFDFRGHGASSGRYAWSAREHLDLDAVLRYAGQFGYSSVGLLAYSLGAAIAVNAASRSGGIASMVLISPPFSFWDINFHFWEPEMLSDFRDNFSCGWEGKGVRWGNMLLRKPKPLDEIRHIRNVPILFVHGARDWIIKAYHSQKLYEAYKAAEGVKKLVVIENGLHAERLVQQNRKQMEDLILGWFRATLISSKQPPFNKEA